MVDGVQRAFLLLIILNVNFYEQELVLRVKRMAREEVYSYCVRDLNTRSTNACFCVVQHSIILTILPVKQKTSQQHSRVASYANVCVCMLGPQMPAEGGMVPFNSHGGVQTLICCGRRALTM